MSDHRYQRAIEQAAGEQPPVPNATEVYQSNPPNIPPRKKDRGWRFTADGLTLERDLTEAEWSAIPVEMRAMKSALQLNVGDATLYGLECGYIQTYEDMEERTGYRASSIEVYASVCRNIPRLTRVNPLTFKHYQQIAPLPEDERPHWISYAASNGLSYRVLKNLIHQVNQPVLIAGGDVITEGVSTDAPTLFDETEEAEIDNQASSISVEQVTKTIKKFTRCIRHDRLQDMPRDDLYLLHLYVQQKWHERKRLDK